MDRVKEVYRTLTERERDRGDGGERERPKMNRVITQELLIISYSKNMYVKIRSQVM